MLRQHVRTLKFRILTGGVLVAVASTLMGGPAFATAHARQRALEQENARKLANLGLSSAPSEEEIAARVARARIQLDDALRPYREVEARAMARARKMGETARANHYQDLVDGMAKRASEFVELLADIRDGVRPPLSELAATLSLYRAELRRVHAVFTDPRMRAISLGTHDLTDEERTIAHQAALVLEAMDGFPEDPAEATWEDVSNMVTRVAERVEHQRLRNPGGTGRVRNPLFQGYDALRGRFRHPPAGPPGLRIAPSRQPRSDGDLFLLFGDQALVSPEPLAPPPGVAARARPAPTPDDLGETPDTRLNADLEALAQTLGPDPLTIFSYVSNHFVYDPYYGSRDGAAGALSHGYGNDMDLASLLIALLRYHGIPARYEYGTIEIPVDRALEMLGVDDVGTAGTVLASQGVPAVVLYAGTDPVAIRMERTWVVAYVPYTNYRGIDGGQGGGDSLWVALDPSFKVQRVSNVEDLRGLGSFDIATFIDQGTDVSPMAFYGATVRNALADAGRTCPTLEQGRHKLEVVQADYSLLPATLPYEVVGTPVEATSLPSSVRYALTVQTTDIYGWVTLSTTLNLPEIFGKRLAVTFPAGGGLDSSLSGTVTTTVSLDEEVIATGDSLGAGNDVQLYLTLYRPGNSSYVRTHDMVAGGTYVINLEHGYIHPDRLAALEAEIQRLQDTGASQAALDRRIAQLAGLQYAAQLYNDDRLLFDLEGFYYSPQYESLTGAEASPRYFWGLVNGATRDGYMVDAEEELFGAPYHGPFVLDDLATLISTAGWTGSFWEHAVWGRVVTAEGLSTTNVLQVSKAEGQQIHYLYSYDDYLAVSSRLSHDATVLADVESTLASGGFVVIHDHTLDYQGRTISGYLLGDPETGAGRYLIHHQMGGGVTTLGDFVLSLFAGVANCITRIMSDVEVRTGNLIVSHDDMTWNSAGPDIYIQRTYNSQDTRSTAMGYGWSWSYGESLEVDGSSGEVTYHDSRGERRVFTPNGDGTFEPGSGFFWDLSWDGTSYRLDDPDGVAHFFDADGRLVALQDVYGNEVTVQYSAQGDIEAILDPRGRVAFSFTVENGLIVSIQAGDGRTVSYGHESGRLTSYTGPEGETWEYTYYENGLLGAVTGPDRLVNYYYYDQNGRLVQYADQAGRAGFLSYDDVNRRTTHTNLEGATSVLMFDENGHCTGYLSPAGTEEKRTYQDGRLASRTDARGETTSYAYDEKGHVATVTGPDGTTVEQVYEADTGRLLSVSAPGFETTITYDDAAGTRTVTATNGQSTTYQLADDGQIVGVSREDGTLVTVTRDPDSGWVTAIDETDAMGNARSTNLVHDDVGRVVTVARGDEPPMHVAYDDASRVVAMATDTGTLLQLEYDARGNLSRLMDGDGVTVMAFDYQYDLLRGQTDGLGRTVSVAYDARGLPVQVQDPYGRTRFLEYDQLGRVSRQSDFRGNVTETAWCADLPDEPCGIIDPLGNLVLREFDEHGHIVSETTPLGTTTWTRDADGRVLSVTDPLGRVTEYTYTSAGQVTSVTDPLGQTTTYEYDSRGRLLKRTDPLGNETTFAYDYAGHLVSMRDAAGGTTSYTYHPNGQRATTTYPDGSTRSRTYTPFGLISEERFADSDGTTLLTRTFEYDSKGFLVSVSTGDSTVTYPAHDPVGQVTAISDETTGQTFAVEYDSVTGFRSALERVDGTVRYTYDPNGNLASIQAPNGDLFRFEYDRFDRLVRKTYPNRAVETRTYDLYGRLQSIVHWDAGGAIVAGESYEYDAVNRLVAVTDEEGNRTEYTYDAANRLVEIAGPFESRRFEYDAAGNRVKIWEGGTLVESCSYNALHQVTECDRQGTVTTYQYDARGNLVEEQAGGVSTHYTYDAASQLVRVDGPAGTVQFTYDALGRRTSVSNAQGTRYFVYDDTQLQLELDEDLNLVRSFIMGPVVDDLLAVTTHQGTPSTFYYHPDRRHSVMALSNESGAMVARYRYGAYGNLLQGGEGVTNQWLFASRPWNEDIRRYDFRARWYDPELGRFLQKDPIEVATVGIQRTGFAAMLSAARKMSLADYLKDPIGQHPYAFANDAPTLYWDPAGEGTFELVVKYLAAFVFSSMTLDTGTNYFPVIWTNVLLGQAYSWELGPSVVGAISDPCMLRDPIGMMLGYIWANAIDQVIKPMRAELFPNPSGTTLTVICLTRMMKIGENWKDQMISKAEALVHGVDCAPPGMLFWVIMAWQTYFLLLNYWMIYLFQMPTFSINVPAECSCWNWP